MIIRFVDSSALGQSANGDYAVCVSDSAVYENTDGIWDDSNEYSVGATDFSGCQDVELTNIKFSIVENNLPLRDSQGDIVTSNCSVDLYIESTVCTINNIFSGMEKLFGIFAKALDTSPITYTIDSDGQKENVAINIPSVDRMSVILVLLDELIKTFNKRYGETQYQMGVASLKHADLPFPTVYNDYLGK